MINENPNRSIETKRSATERVDERLIKGDFNDYSQLARDEDTTPEFVAKRAHYLKKDGKLAGDRRTSRTKPEGVSDVKPDAGNAVIDDKIHMQRMEAYRLAGVPEEDIAIMDAGHLDLNGLKKLREDARALRHDKKAEQLAKEFRTMGELEDFTKFYHAATKNGTTQHQYDELMAGVREGQTLLEHIEQIRVADDAYIRRHAEYMQLSDEMTKMREEQKTMIDMTTKMEERKSAVEQFFKDVREGKQHSESIEKIVSAAVETVLAGNEKWKILVAASCKVLTKYPRECMLMDEAFATGETDRVEENKMRVGLVILEAQEYFEQAMKNHVHQPVREEVANSLWSGRRF